MSTASDSERRNHSAEPDLPPPPDATAENPVDRSRQRLPEPPPIATENHDPRVPPIVAASLPKAEPAPPPQTGGLAEVSPPRITEVAAPPQDAPPVIGAPGYVPDSRRSGQRKRSKQGSRPATVLAAATTALLILLGIVYVIVGLPNSSRDTARVSSPREQEASRSVAPSAARSDEPALPSGPAPSPVAPAEPPRAAVAADQSERPPDPEPTAEPPAGHEGEIVAQVMIDLHEGQFQIARQRLLDALKSPDSSTRSWARGLLEEIEFATSVYEAQKTLTELDDEQLEQLLRGTWLPPAAQRLSYPSLRQRFVVSLREQLPAEFQRRQVARAESPGTAEPPGPDEHEPAAPTDSSEQVPLSTTPAENAKTPEARLAEKGLVHRGDFWLLERDDDLKASVLELKGLEQKSSRVDAEWNEIRQRHLQWQIQEDRARQARQTGVVAQIQQQLRPGREILARWMRAGSEFTLAVVRSAAKVRQMKEEYERLSDDREVQDALSELDPASNRLGPSPVFEQNARRIDDFASRLPIDQTLIFWSDEDPEVFFVDVIVNDAAAAMLALRPTATFNLIPEHVLREAGIAVEGDGGRELTIGGVSFFAREVTVPSLRIGQIVSRDVRAYVLPAQMRRLQGFLSSDAFPDLWMNARRSDNVLTIRPREETEDADP